MAEENFEELAGKLKERGLTCPSLKKRIDDSIKDSEDFRKLGFTRLADVEMSISNELKNLHKKVCRKL